MRDDLRIDRNVVQEHLNRSLEQASDEEVSRGVKILCQVVANLGNISTSDRCLGWIEGKDGAGIINLPRISLAFVFNSIHIPVAVAAQPFQMKMTDEEIAYFLTENLLGRAFKIADRIRADCQSRMKDLHDARADAIPAPFVGRLPDVGRLPSP